MMGISKNYQYKKKQKQSSQSKNAYKPKAPYAAVEGIESPAYEKLINRSGNSRDLAS